MEMVEGEKKRGMIILKLTDNDIQRGVPHEEMATQTWNRWNGYGDGVWDMRTQQNTITMVMFMLFTHFGS